MSYKVFHECMATPPELSVCKQILYGGIRRSFTFRSFQVCEKGLFCWRESSDFFADKYCLVLVIPASVLMRLAFDVMPTSPTHGDQRSPINGRSITASRTVVNHRRVIPRVVILNTAILKRSMQLLAPFVTMK